jgi:hypothetical protein
MHKKIHRKIKFNSQRKKRMRKKRSVIMTKALMKNKEKKKLKKLMINLDKTSYLIKI